jgi:hypothetical protein
VRGRYLCFSLIECRDARSFAQRTTSCCLGSRDEVLAEIPGARDRLVAVALVSSGELAAIALAECNRRGAGLSPQNRSVRLALD